MEKLFFIDTNTGDLGSLDAAIDLTDAEALNLIGIETISSYYDGAALWAIAQKNNVGMAIKAAAGSTSIYVGGVARSSSMDYSASGLQLKIGIVKD